MLTLSLKSKVFIVAVFVLLNSKLGATDKQEMQDPLMGRVASAHPLATQAGLDTLKRGGNAFDAAIAVASTLNVVEPMMSGIGGYGTILVYDAKEKQIRFLNASGRFPKETNTDFMREQNLDYMKNRNGSKSISTPGNLNAWKELHEKFGTMPWNGLFERAIFYAENGFKVTPHAASWLANSIGDFSAYSKSFYCKEGRPLAVGETLIQMDLAKTFKLIAEKGTNPFYHGEIARVIEKQMKEIGSFLSLEDLNNNKAEWWNPIKFDYRGYDIYTAGLPANSFSAFVTLSLMQELNPGNFEHNSANYLHLLAEMAKLSDKARLKHSRDPEVDNTPIQTVFSMDTLKPLAKSIDMYRATHSVTSLKQESHNTTHFVVTDKWGNIVSATQTLGNMFGSKVMIEGTGIWMNSSIGFSIFEPKGNPMDALPGRHKLSGDCPVIIMKNGHPWAALGTPGGHTITQNVPQIIFNLIDFKMTIQQAIDAPKIAFIEPDLIRAEKGILEAVLGSLKERGHTIEEGTIGNATGVRIMNQGGQVSFEVGIDKRRDGQSSVHNSSE